MIYELNSAPAPRAHENPTGAIKNKVFGDVDTVDTPKTLSAPPAVTAPETASKPPIPPEIVGEKVPLDVQQKSFAQELDWRAAAEREL